MALTDLLPSLVDIEVNPETSADAEGGVQSAWTTYAEDVPCLIKSLRGRAVPLHGRDGVLVTTKVVFGADPGPLDLTYRLKHTHPTSGRITYYRVEWLDDVERRGTKWDVYCSQRTA